MNIVFAADALIYPQHSGAERVNATVLAQLAARGHTVTAIARSIGFPGGLARDQLHVRLASRGIAVTCDGELDRFRFDGVDVVGLARERGPDTPALLADLLEHTIARVRPDRLVVSTEDPGHVLLRRALAAKLPVALIANTVSFVPFGPASLAPDGDRTLFDEIDAIVTTSNAAVDYLRTWGQLEATCCYVPVYGTGPFARLGSFDGAIGLINPCTVKGISIFVAVARALPQLRFAAVPTWGTTEDDLALLRGVPNVQLVPRSDDIDVIFAQLSLLLVPSLWFETFGLVAVESLLRGVPVVASNAGGLPEAALGSPVIPVEQIRPFRETPTSRLRAVATDVAPQPWIDAVTAVCGDRDRYEAEVARGRAAARAFVAGLSIEPFERVLAALG